MEHATSQRMISRSPRPELTTGLIAAGRAFARIGSWLASDPIGDRLEGQHDHDAQMALRVDRRPR